MFETIPKIRLFINWLLILEIFIGVMIISVSWFYQLKLSAFLTESEGKMITSKFFNIHILGFQMVAAFLCSISMWASVWSRSFSENTQLLLNTWSIFCFFIVAGGCANIWVLFTSSDSVSQVAEILLLKGIDNYYLKPEWKLLWDKLQYDKECCGVHGYQDWLQANWMLENLKDCKDNQIPEEIQDFTTECSPLYEDSKNDYIEPSRQNIESNQILAPYACCKHNSTLCYENYMPHHVKRNADGSSHLPHLNLADINTEGCFPIFTDHLIFAVNFLFILIVLAVFIEILICSLTKYLMASNYKRRYREYNNDGCMIDDEGNALVVIKCPPNVRCITLEEPNHFSGSDIPNVASSLDLCPCCSGDHANIDIKMEHLPKAERKNDLGLLH